jgi:tryptophanyl-tRNA synthetase
VPDAATTTHRIFSGIQPSGIVHLGNDLGAIRNYVALQEQFEAIYCIVDYHALTSLHDADALRRQTREMAASLLALGLDTTKCTLFVQSHRPEHTELAWLFATVTPVSWVERTPSYKEKREQQPDDVNHGLLTYPILQAADIVIYLADRVPVGKDQAAHLELSREIVRAFNRRYGDTFPEPEAVFTEAPVVLGTDGVRKMSKSLGNAIEILVEVFLIFQIFLFLQRTEALFGKFCNGVEALLDFSFLQSEDIGTFVDYTIDKPFIILFNEGIACPEPVAPSFFEHSCGNRHFW